MTKISEKDVQEMLKDIFYDFISATVDNCTGKSEDYSTGYANGMVDGSKITVMKLTAFIQKAVEENTPKDEDPGDDYREIIKEFASRMN